MLYACSETCKRQVVQHNNRPYRYALASHRQQGRGTGTQRGKVLHPLPLPRQYLDTETGLAYNRFRYYPPETGAHISQNPISIAGGLNVHVYVHDSNSSVASLGLSSTPITFTSGSGQTHQVSRYTNFSHTTDSQLNTFYHSDKRPDERAAFNKWKQEYWESQAKAESKARGKKDCH